MTFLSDSVFVNIFRSAKGLDFYGYLISKAAKTLEVFICVLRQLQIEALH